MLERATAQASKNLGAVQLGGDRLLSQTHSTQTIGKRPGGPWAPLKDGKHGKGKVFGRRSRLR
eukprot:9378364-Pyramimonas_sp.AAC.1